MRGFITYTVLFAFVYTTNAQIITIPDNNFKQAIVKLGIDTTESGGFLQAVLDSVILLNVINAQIDSLDGIEYFVNLEELNCSFNKIKKLELNNKKLEVLKCSYNQIDTVKTNALDRLNELDVSNNQLLYLDISKNDSLIDLNTSQNQLSQLEFSHCDSLKKLNCSNNQLKFLNLNSALILNELNVSVNQLDSIKIDNNAKLEKLDCSDNDISELWLNNNPLLKEIKCVNNKITRLELKNHLYLKYLLCNGNNLEQVFLTKTDSLQILNCSENILKIIDIKECRQIANLHVSGNELISLDLSLNDSLEFLNCSDNLMESLSTNSNAVLSTLLCQKNRLIGKLDLSENDSIHTVDCSDNRLYAIDIRNVLNEELETFNCTKNPFLICIQVDDITKIGENWEKDNSASYCTDCKFKYTVLNDSAFEQALIDYKLDDILDSLVHTDSIRTLEELDIRNRGIKDLTGIGDFKALTSLNCSNNKIEYLDLTKNNNLHTILCNNNSLTYLNVQGLNSLAYLSCKGNDLNHLDLVDNAQLTMLVATDNSSLRCIEVSGAQAAMDRNSSYAEWEVDDEDVFSGNCHSDDTKIPDAAFEHALISLSLDTVPDHFVRTSHIDTIKSLIIDSLKILDLAGIEGFAALEVLDCTGNYLDSISLDSLVNLKTLNCSNNQLKELQLASLKQLDTLFCSNNLLTSLKTDSAENLKVLVCDKNKLEVLNLEKNAKLEIVSCSANQLTTENFICDQLSELHELYCSSNQLTGLVVGADSLTVLNCMNNQIDILDPGLHKYLERLDCSLNQLTKLDVQACDKLQQLTCSSNELSFIQFGSNSFLSGVECNDNQLASLKLNTLVGLEKLNCSQNQIGSISFESQSKLKILNASYNRLASDSIFPNTLEVLDCSYNVLKTLDVSKIENLKWLNCDSTEIEILDISENLKLDSLSASHNKLNELNLASNALLKNLYLTHNTIQSLNTDSVSFLEQLYCSNNQIDTLRLQNNDYLIRVDASNNKLTFLNIKNGKNHQLELFSAFGNPNLFCIQADESTKDKIESKEYTQWFPDSAKYYNSNCRYCETEIVDSVFEKCLIDLHIDTGPPNSYVFNDSISKVTKLDVSKKQISDLTGIEAFVSLDTLIVTNNNLTSLDLRSNDSLLVIYCDTNQLTDINLGGLEKLKFINCNSNNFKSLYFNTNTQIDSIICSNNDLEVLNIKNGKSANVSYIDATSNDRLTCIEVDEDMIGEAPVDWEVGENAKLVNDCHYYQTYIADENFEKALITLGVDTGDVNKYVYNDSINYLENLYIDNKNISDLTGIEEFSSLKELSCRKNNLNKIILNNHEFLEVLDISKNNIVQIDLTELPNLKDLNVAENSLLELNLLSNKDIEILDCSSNTISELDFSEHKSIGRLKASKNNLVSVNLQNQSNDNLKYLDLRDNPELRCILVDNIDEAVAYSNWYKYITAHYKYFCDDDDNDGVKNEEDQCPITPYGDLVDLFGCSAYFLPNDNFDILVKGESCKDSNNGAIQVVSKVSNTYLAKLKGGDYYNEFVFTDSLNVKNLNAQIYDLCISLQDDPDIKHCFTVQINEPEDLIVKSSRIENSDLVTYVLKGSDAYQLNHNGQENQIDGDEFTLQLKQGYNRISVHTAHDCQGQYEDVIYYSDKLMVQPNPFSHHLYLSFGKGINEKVDIIISTMEGHVIYQSKDMLTEEIYEIDADFLQPGVYVLTVRGKGYKSSTKIIKL